MAIIGDILRNLGLVDPGEPQEPEDIGVNEVGAEESVVEDWKVIAEEIYPDAEIYNGPSFRESIKFKGVRAINLKPDWLLKTVIWGECKKADATPLKAILKERKIKTPYFPDIFSEYELIFHYHDSPLIIAIGGLIVGTLIAAGFLILATKAPEPEDWKAIITKAKDITEQVVSAIKWGVLGLGGFYLIKKFK